MEKQARTIADINAEYTNICTQIGERQFRVTQLNHEITSYAVRIKQLQAEAKELESPPHPTSGAV